MKSLIKKNTDRERKQYFLPAVDIRNTDDAVVIYAEVPGIAKDNINIQVENNVLTISAEATEEKLKGYQTVISERLPRRFKRTFHLSDAVNQDKIDAQLNNGLLVLTLPKAESAKPKKIKVQVS